MAYETVLYDVAERVCTITLNRPERLNAWTRQMHLDLREALHRAGADPEVRAIILTGAGRGFCAGADLKALGGADGARDSDWGTPRGMIDLPLLLRDLPQPSVCAVNGVAAGAGFGLAVATDLCVASTNASFVAAQIRTAQIPDAGLTWILPRLLGAERAARVCLLAETISAEDARALGLVGEVVAPGHLMPRALDLAERLAALPRTAVRLTRDALAHGMTSDLGAALQREYDGLIEANRDPDVAEAVRAFAEKRPPRFR